MRLNLTDFVPQTFGNREFFVEGLKSKIKVSSKRLGKYGSNPRSIILPKYIEIDRKFAEAIGLYFGEGKLTKYDLHHSSFVNKDEDIIKFMFEFFRDYMDVLLEQLTLTIAYTYGDINEIRKKWSVLLNVPKTKFYSKKTNRNKKDTLTIQINSTLFRIVFQNIIFKLLSRIKKEDKLRRGFLRGYFAAEGTIGFNKRKNFLNYIGFSYNPIHESWLKDYCMECLRLKNIKSKYKERKNNRGEIIITKWNDYYKLWSIKIFDRCIRKKRGFYNILVSRRIYCKLDDNFRRKFFNSINLSQKAIARLINSWQGNICRIIDGMHLPTIKQLKTLSKYSRFSEKKIIKNIEKIRVGCVKHFIENKNFINYLFRIS